jgi:hypothetical protein
MKDEMDGTCSTRGRVKKCIHYPKGRGHSEGVGVDGRIILEWILEKQGGKLWTGCIWLRIGTSSGLLWTG